MAHLTGKMYRVGYQPNPRSQYNPHLQIPGSIFPQSTTGKITPSGKPCYLGNVETALHAIVQTIALLVPNPHDPRLQPNGKLIFALKCQFQSYKKEDPPPTHVKPLPAKLIKLAVQACCASNTARDTCIADMITIGFFFLYCPGEQTVTFDNEPFKLSNVQFYKEDKPVHIQSSKLLHTADFLTLTFDTQKNRVKRQAYRSQTFYFCNTLPHTGSSTPGGSPQPTQGKVTSTTLLLFSYSK